ncbi:YslB family protein [Bacillus sp. FJAT-42376]|uniref:YslB family protein n=1 Tax=Bacillus sp. FJAT-42376 TaxID=2014076 RepID=UPI001F15573D|nr:YslB family protein [Bacillus sp. FJAT-42376]
MRNQVEADALEELHVPAFGHELLREVLLPEILGQEYPSMLYWAGRKLARHYPLETAEELPQFFALAGWGTLSLIHRKQGEMEFELSSDLIDARFKSQKEPSFQLEAGFLAEQVQTIGKHAAEAYEQVKRRSGKVMLTVKWDKKDQIDE